MDEGEPFAQPIDADFRIQNCYSGWSSGHEVCGLYLLNFGAFSTARLSRNCACVDHPQKFKLQRVTMHAKHAPFDATQRLLSAKTRILIEYQSVCTIVDFKHNRVQSFSI
ncbi:MULTISPECIES: hypothetical protein [Paraburkholderia]|uniref:Uncharacterized protein n=1 Tax=Paraburkholderia fynbosensis TaxID=1200993 RepID=A0A6J5GJJ7_9BURK|nr:MULTISPECIES: hypothetical protein [Paraburkholderia]MBC8730254.1 hypothetical protein [Paraburkholderia sp. UCT2]CAB3801394.1 hypothetical protein LMG27177_05046 [Paraburkholderia fynbosensis]